MAQLSKAPERISQAGEKSPLKFTKRRFQVHGIVIEKRGFITHSCV